MIRNLKSARILGIDPGTNILGYAIIDVEGDNIIIQNMGVINLQKLETHQDKLREIFLQLQEIIETYLPSQVAVESPFYGKNVQSMLKLGRAQGVTMAAAMTMGLSISEYSPKRVKQSVTGSGNASKEQVAGMLEHLVKKSLKGYKLDATDALALAVCHHFSNSGKFNKNQNSYSGWKDFIKSNPEKIN
jgi:crossover junction endodeoxyribonuclease RuvC